MQLAPVRPVDKRRVVTGADGVEAELERPFEQGANLIFSLQRMHGSGCGPRGTRR
jgi:hypothetical protein